MGCEVMAGACSGSCPAVRIDIPVLNYWAVPLEGRKFGRFINQFLLQTVISFHKIYDFCPQKNTFLQELNESRKHCYVFGWKGRLRVWVIFVLCRNIFKPFFVALQPFVGPWPLFQFVDLTPTAGLLGREISLSEGLYLNTGQTHIHIKHSCTEWDSNPWSQRPSERRQFMA
jgi:hypothetical protein